MATVLALGVPPSFGQSDNVRMNKDTPATQIGFDIETLITECQPASILVIGERAQGYIEDYVAQKKIINQDCSVTPMSVDMALSELKQKQPYDVGIVTDAVEYLDKDRSGQLIARLRDIHTARFLMVIRMGDKWDQLKSIWQTVDLLGFGMKLVNRYEFDDKPIHVYKYDISTYKKTPEWLNAKNWANPQLWDKFRW